MNLIIFDFDGTLFQLPIDWKGLKNVASKIFNLPLSETKSYRLTQKDNPNRKIFLELQHSYEDEVVSEDRIEMIKQLIPSSMLSELKKLGKMAILTNNFESTVHKLLKFHNMENMFSLCVGRETMTDKNLGQKPDPDGIIYIKNTIKHDDVVFIGDFQMDEDAAQAADVKFIRFENNPKDVIKQIKNLLS